MKNLSKKLETVKKMKDFQNSVSLISSKSIFIEMDSFRHYSRKLMFMVKVIGDNGNF